MLKNTMMAKKSKSNRLTKQIARDQIERTLASSLGDLQAAIGKKKFERRMKKVIKILSDGLPKAPKTKTIKVKNIILPGQDKKSLASKDSNGSVEPNMISKL
jgi:hypothetical protein